MSVAEVQDQVCLDKVIRQEITDLACGKTNEWI